MTAEITSAYAWRQAENGRSARRRARCGIWLAATGRHRRPDDLPVRAHLIADGGVGGSPGVQNIVEEIRTSAISINGDACGRAGREARVCIIALRPSHNQRKNDVFDNGRRRRAKAF